MHLCHNPLCCFVPPYIADNLKDSDNPVVRQIALASLGNEYRTARRLLGTLPVVTSLAGLIAGKERYIFDMNGDSDPLPGKLLRKEGDPPSQDEAVNEAYDNSGDVYDFYKEVFDRDSLDDAGLPLRSSVHVGDTFGGPMSNAFFNGQQMAYGDGDGNLFISFTKSLDVVGHELTHGVVSFTSDLEYFFESGALNESFADVMGSLITQWKNKQTVDQADWYIGNEVLGPGAKIKGLRTLTAEKAYENDRDFGTDPQPKHYKNLYTGPRDRKGVHINSGIPNHAFYLVATKIGGYAWEKAGPIWYKTLLALNRKSKMKDAAEQSYTIAGTLFGSNSLEQQAVKEAWDAVGLSV